MTGAPEVRCPLCGADSGCGVAAGKSSCWCFHQVVAPEALAALPPRAIGAHCLCSRCASGIAPSPCVGTCSLDPTGAHCVGCRRTVDEIVAWRGMDDAQRWAVWHRLVKAEVDDSAGP